MTIRSITNTYNLEGLNAEMELGWTHHLYVGQPMGQTYLSPYLGPYLGPS